jgi:hypothetical protein
MRVDLTSGMCGMAPIAPADRGERSPCQHPHLVGISCDDFAAQAAWRPSPGNDSFGTVSMMQPLSSNSSPDADPWIQVLALDEM